MSEAEQNQATILVVDDEEIVLSFVCDALENENADIITANSPAQALEIINQKNIDLLITDIKMPGMNGIELFEKAAGCQPNLRSIFMTGYANLSSAKEAIRHGAIDYILKPFELSEIRRAARKAIDIIEGSKSQDPQGHLATLTGLRQILFAADDHRAIALSSLKFGMMHIKCVQGCIIYQPTADSKPIMLIQSNRKVEEPELLLDESGFAFRGVLSGLPRTPTLLSYAGDNPVASITGNNGHTFPLPNWCSGEHGLILVPVMSSDQVCGVLMYPIDNELSSFQEIHLEFLTLVSGQLYSALLNLSLLDEARQAYSDMRELQALTVELEAMATRGKMSAEIGHDLNNFLGVVSGNLSMLRLWLQKGKYEKLESCIDKADKTIEKMTSFTANLMDLRTITPNRDQIRADELLREVVEHLLPQRKYQSINLLLSKDLPPLEFFADFTQVQQLLYNLINNAAEATSDASEPKIEIRLSSESAGRLSIFIKDNGQGCSPDLIEKAFKEKFTTKPDGHGFGLIICKRIVEIHGGEISMTSTPGNGTTVEVQFPALSAEPVPA